MLQIFNEFLGIDWNSLNFFLVFLFDIPCKRHSFHLRLYFTISLSFGTTYSWAFFTLQKLNQMRCLLKEKGKGKNRERYENTP